MKRLLTSLLSFVLLFSSINVNALSNDNISTYTNEFNLIANNGLGAINLDWSSYNGNNVTFKGYSSNDGGQTYQSISLMDYTSVKDVKVLNIYPDIGDGLKSWMEDISMSSTGTPIGKGIIHVDKVPISDFNQNVQNYLYKINGEWNYDVIVFGFWDRNNCRDLSTSSKDVVDKFISDGGGCIFGHDVALNNAILATDTYEYTSGPIKNGQNNFDYLARKYFPFMSYKANNYIGGSIVYVTKKGLFTSYPYNLGEIGTHYDIPICHTWGQIISNTNNVWMAFGPTTNSENFYLVTNNNVAMNECSPT